MQLSAEKFREIVAALKSDAAQARDKRTAPRVGLTAQVTILPPPGGNARPERARCRDLSADGLGLMCTRRMNVGEAFVIGLRSNELGKSVHVHCVAVYCTSLSDDLCLVGAHINEVVEHNDFKPNGHAA